MKFNYKSINLSIFVLLFFALAIFMTALASAADPGHGASVIGSGTFESGNYTFPEWLNVTGVTIVSQGITAGKGLLIGNTGGGLYANRIMGDGSHLYIGLNGDGTGTNGLWILTHGGTGKFFFREDGKVTIGSNSQPAYTLDVQGTGAFLNNLTVDTNVFHVDTVNNTVGIGTVTPMTYGAKLAVVGAGVGRGIVATSDIESYTKIFAPQLTIDSIPSTYGGGNLTITPITSFSNNVGIGTTSPGATLHVQGTGIVSTSLRTNSLQDYGGNLTITTVGSGRDIAFSPANVQQMRLEASGGLALGSGYVGTDPGAGNMIISGNVGIGTTSPGGRLDTVGRILTSGASGEIALANRATNALSFSLYSPTAGYLGFYDQANSQERMTILGSGNVGIGTTVPGAKLHVYEDNGAIVNSIFGDNVAGHSDSVYLMGNSINGGYSYNGDNKALWLNYAGYQGGATYYRDLVVYNGKNSPIATFLGSTGNVGIGTASPATKLEVYTDANNKVQLASGYAEIYRQGNQMEIDAAFANTAANGGAIAAVNGISLAGALGYRHLFINTTGNVGIGTTSPTYKLEVNGTINATAASGGAGIYTDNSGNVVITI